MNVASYSRQGPIIPCICMCAWIDADPNMERPAVQKQKIERYYATRVFPIAIAGPCVSWSLEGGLVVKPQERCNVAFPACLAETLHQDPCGAFFLPVHHRARHKSSKGPQKYHFRFVDRLFLYCFWQAVFCSPIESINFTTWRIRIR